MKENSDGNPVTIDVMKSYGFEKQITEDCDGDEIKRWYKEGVTIYEHSWWITDGKSCYNADETEPEIEFSFATYVKGDGRFKSGYHIQTDTHLENIYYALTSKKLTKI